MRTILHFSPTGNVKYIAERLAGEIGFTSTDIMALEFTEPDKLTQKDQLIIIYSIHAFIRQERLRGL